MGALPRVTAVVLDECSDASGAIVRRHAARLAGGPLARLLVLERSGANVGAARRAGCSAVIAELAETHGIAPGGIWVATTDADSQVPPAWLAVQVARHEQGVDVWTGRVTVADWSQRSAALPHAWRRRYDAEAAPAHGTSLGFAADRYLAVGGFEPVPAHEDQRLHRALLAAGAVGHHDRSVPVVTSARRVARAPAGFAHALALIESGLPAR